MIGTQVRPAADHAQTPVLPNLSSSAQERGPGRDLPCRAGLLWLHSVILQLLFFCENASKRLVYKVRAFVFYNLLGLTKDSLLF